MVDDPQKLCGPAAAQVASLFATAPRVDVRLGYYPSHRRRVGERSRISMAPRRPTDVPICKLEVGAWVFWCAPTQEAAPRCLRLSRSAGTAQLQHEQVIAWVEQGAPRSADTVRGWRAGRLKSLVELQAESQRRKARGADLFDPQPGDLDF